MTIFIVGGSNSVRKGGWVDHFTPEATNISIGASTSIMGAYRSLFSVEVQPGDTVIWEYALNDANQALGTGRAYTVDYLLGYCEVIIRMCAKRGARFIPLIFTPQRRERLPEIDAYRLKLHRMLRHYGIPFVDISRELRRILEVETLPDSIFFDDFHYAEDSRAVKRAARRAERLISDDFRPVDPDVCPMFIAPDISVELFTDFEGARAGEFSNKLLTIPVFEPANLPLTLGPRIRGGRIVGIFMISPPDGGVLELSISEKSGAHVDVFDMSVAHSEPNFSKPVFKMFSLVNARREPVNFEAGQSISLSHSTGAGEPLTDMGFAEMPASFPKTSKVSIAGILVEQRA
ncbi:MAG: SGNH/GDSL hydrolase family protein [Shimia thalassica]|uniref:SGNH/GDSL hydrolase family protein n=1 Tax=Shimia thalassica TaxID=1715693 RepID=UPI003299CAB1